MQKLYLNTIDRTWYDADGSAPSDSNPQIPLGNSERIAIQCCTETPNAGTPGIDPETDWTKDTQYNLTGVTALLSADNNFLRHIRGQLKTAVSSGTVSSVEMTIQGATFGKIPSTGSVRLFDAAGNYEALEYTTRSISGTTVTFTLAEGSSLENSYDAGAVSDCPESLYAQASLNAGQSNPATGLFVFDIVMDSLKLRETSDYADISEIGDVKGLELLIFTVVDDVITIKNAYICSTLRIPVPMASPDQNPDMPDTYESNVAAMISALLSAGFSLQFSTDNANWHDTQTSSDLYFRFRSSSAGGNWSVGIALIQGPAGENGITPHIDSTTKHWMIGTTDTGVVAQGQPGEPGTSAYVYVAYASDDQGTGWSLTPSDSLPYRAEIHPDEEIENPTASDFEDAVWVKYLGDDFSDTSYLTFDSVSASNLVTLTSDCVPVAVKSGITGKFYPVEKGSVSLGTGSFTLDLTPYLAYDNAQTFSGTWTVYLAAGLPGEQQDGNEIVTLTGTAITPDPDVVFKKTLAADDAFTIDTSALTATRQLTFELHLIQPATAVSFTLPASLVWPIGDEFTSTASPPAMSTGGMMYAIVIRWDGANLLANLAYTKGTIA